MQATTMYGPRRPPEAALGPRRPGKKGATRTAPSCDEDHNDDTNNGDHTNATDQSLMGKTASPMRRGISFRRTVQRIFSKRSIFGESRCSHRGILPYEEQSLDDLDLETDDEEEFKTPAVNKNNKQSRRVPPVKKDTAAVQPTMDATNSPTGTTQTWRNTFEKEEENTSITTRDSSLADGIPSVIYVVHDSFLAKVNQRGLIRRIQHTLRNVTSNRQLLNDSDEEAYTQTLVEL
jgi:hypothetical protein